MTIIIPCFNEAERLPIKKYEQFLERFENTHIFFVNDASTDDTQEILQDLEKRFPAQVAVLRNRQNKGKAESIRNGVLHLLANGSPEIYAYLDADLATSLEECHSYIAHLNHGKQFVFASRILKIGSIVERRFSRFVAGRIIATVISNILDVKVYDTQCGCKVFTKEIAAIVFEKPFISRWLFDVEIFSRIIKKNGKEKALRLMDEIPVKKWVDIGDSKVKVSYFFQLWVDLFRIHREHNRST